MGSVEPTPESLEAFAREASDDPPVVMINLLRYRGAASYAGGFDAEPCSGREAYQRYGAEVAGLIASAGGRVLWMGEARAAVIAPEGERWDDAVLVEYPSRQAFLEMISKPAYQAVAPHRTAALEDSRLIATVTRASFLNP